MSLKIDLHVHSKYSGDSLNEPEEILRLARQSGLGGVAVVDHGTIKGGEEAIRLNTDEDFIVITGAEIKTDKGEIIGYFLNEEIRSSVFMEAVDEMRSQDALITIPHPFDALRFHRIKEPEDAASFVDAVEVFNSRCMLDASNKKALAFSKKHGLGVTAGSDAHYLDEIGSAGITIKGERIREEMQANKDYFGKKNLFVRARSKLQRLVPK